MRLFGGEWVAGVLAKLGMKEGESIESRMVSKRIEAAQKKVEEYHFDQRKNLLEYDEVMDAQHANGSTGSRNQILHNRNCKIGNPRNDRRSSRVGGWAAFLDE